MKISANISSKNLPNNPDLQRISISLTGTFSSKVNYVFELYRFAVTLNLKGFIKKAGHTKLEIETEGDPSSLDCFAKKLHTLLSKSDIKITCNTKDQLLKYNEFRILKF